jgi:hypothetical protein
MKAKHEDTRLAEQAIKRAAKNVLGEAVRKNEAIPIWNGKEVVWKVPTREFEQMNVPDAPSSRR